MNIIAASGIIIASACLFIVLSGFAGLKDFSLEFSSVVDPDLKVLPAEGKSFSLTETETGKLRKIPGITSFSKVIEERIVIEFDNKNLLASIKGVDKNYLKVTSIDSMIIQGQWFEYGTGQVVSGWGIAHNLSFGVLDYGKILKIYVPKPGKGQISSVRSVFNSINAVNIGVFDVNEDLNIKYVYTDIANARYLMNYEDDQISAVELKLDKNTGEAYVISAVKTVLGNKVIIKNRAQLNDALYKMLNSENLIVYLIFTLVIIIALFNAIGGLIMMILDKKASLQTLFNLGATPKDIKRIFFLQGSLMSVFSGITGLIIGLIVVALQKQFALVMITPSLAYPVVIKPLNILLALATITVLGLLASKIASSRISEKLIRD